LTHWGFPLHKSQITMYFSLGCMWGTLPGQASMHWPQAMQASLSTSTAPVLSLIDRAFVGHDATHG